MFTMAFAVASTSSQVKVYVLWLLIADVLTVVAETTPATAVKLWETPGPVSVQLLSTPVAETVIWAVPPGTTRSGEVVMTGSAVPNSEAPTITFGQLAVDPPAVTDIP